MSPSNPSEESESRLYLPSLALPCVNKLRLSPETSCASGHTWASALCTIPLWTFHARTVSERPGPSRPLLGPQCQRRQHRARTGRRPCLRGHPAHSQRAAQATCPPTPSCSVLVINPPSPAGQIACRSRESLDIPNKKHMCIGQPQKPNQNTIFCNKARISTKQIVFARPQREFSTNA